MGNFQERKKHSKPSYGRKMRMELGILSNIRVKSLRFQFIFLSSRAEHVGNLFLNFAIWRRRFSHPMDDAVHLMNTIIIKWSGHCQEFLFIFSGIQGTHIKRKGCAKSFTRI
jgi:hypothetical protein